MANNMSPESSPSGPESFGGKRVNNLPLIIAGVCLVAFVVIVALVASERSKLRVVEEENLTAKNSAGLDLQVAGPQKTGFVNGPAKHKEKESSGTVIDPQPLSSETVIEPQPFLTEQDTRIAPSGPDPYEKERAIVKDYYFRMLGKAIIATPEVSSPQQHVSASSNSKKYSSLSKRDQLLAKISELKRRSSQAEEQDPTKAYQARLAALQATMGDSGGGGSNRSSTGGFGLASASAATGPSGNYKDSLLNPDGKWKLNSEIKAPETAFTLRAGFVIPGIMITGINSELPGRISGQVSQNVYDTATGMHLLLPQGTRLDGAYVNDVAYGQSRLMIAWNRLIFPDGKALDIGKMPGSDSAGYAGFSDQVNNHYFRIFGSAVLMSGITAGVAYSQPDSSYDDRNSFSDTLSESLGQNLGQVMVAMIKKNMNIAPTLEIRPGYRFNILTVKDMVFTGPYQQFDY